MVRGCLRSANNTSQLAGFTKKNDLRFFLREICGIDYKHESDLAPTQELLNEYKKQKGSWHVYEREFNRLMETRAIERSLSLADLHLGCLLCSEKRPEHCHRSLVAEYLQRHWSDVQITHLV